MITPPDPPTPEATSAEPQVPSGSFRPREGITCPGLLLDFFWSSDAECRAWVERYLPRDCWPEEWQEQAAPLKAFAHDPRPQGHAVQEPRDWTGIYHTGDPSNPLRVYRCDDLMIDCTSQDCPHPAIFAYECGITSTYCQPCMDIIMTDAVPLAAPVPVVPVGEAILTGRYRNVHGYHITVTPIDKGHLCVGHIHPNEERSAHYAFDLEGVSTNHCEGCIRFLVEGWTQIEDGGRATPTAPIAGVPVGETSADDFADYRKKPVVIQARQLTEPMDIPTLEGTMRGDVGDWIIIGVNGEQYPCKPDIFAKTYEPASQTPAAPIAGVLTPEQFRLNLECVQIGGLKDARVEKNIAALKAHDAALREQVRQAQKEQRWAEVFHGDAVATRDKEIRRCDQLTAQLATAEGDYATVHRALEIRDGEGLLWQKRAEVAEGERAAIEQALEAVVRVIWPIPGNAHHIDVVDIGLALTQLSERHPALLALLTGAGEASDEPL